MATSYTVLLSGQFFFLLLVSAMLLEVVKKKFIPRWLGFTCGYNFYMGMQNKSKLEI